MELGDDGVGRNAVFQLLYERYLRRVVWFIGQHGFSREDSRDLAQVVFLRVFEHMDEYRRESEWTYLATTAHHVALNEIRRREAVKRDGEHVSLEDAVEAPQLRAEAPDYAENEQHVLRRLELYAAIDGLPRSLREPLLLWVVPKSYKEIQCALHLTEDAVKSRLQEARNRLISLLGPNRR
jgi:RNA polymerase sigma-70 factor (ECF subfamily)